MRNISTLKCRGPDLNQDKWRYLASQLKAVSKYKLSECGDFSRKPPIFLYRLNLSRQKRMHAATSCSGLALHPIWPSCRRRICAYKRLPFERLHLGIGARSVHRRSRGCFGIGNKANLFASIISTIKLASFMQVFP